MQPISTVNSMMGRVANVGRSTVPDARAQPAGNTRQRKPTPALEPLKVIDEAQELRDEMAVMRTELQEAEDQRDLATEQLYQASQEIESLKQLLAKRK